MKKTLIASAVAAASMAALSTGVMAGDNPAGIYGNIQLVQTYVDDGVNDGKSSFSDNGSTIGFKHSHEISPGVTGFLKAEMEFTADDKKASSGLSKLDEAYIGVKGDFGKIWIGSDDTAYENVDVIDMYEAVGIYGDLAGMNEGNTLQYMTPKIGGGLTAQVTLELDDPGEGASSKHVGGLSVAYAMDNIKLIGAYAMAEDDNMEDSFGLAAVVSMGDISVKGQYEHNDDTDLFGALAVASMGKNQFAGGVKYLDEDDSTVELYVQALHNASDNIYVYVEGHYIDADAAPDTVTEVALGATYSF